MNATIHHGDCSEVMREMEAGSIDSIVTDPPYDLKGKSGKGGFMGKAWDGTGIAFDPATWEEALRVLKPGGHILAFGGSRTWHRLAVAIEDAGFEIRESIAWMHGQGFPKHRAALKPAFEPIVMGRKPFKGSLTTNEAKYATGALNIDACRIGHDEPDRETRRAAPRYSGTTMNGGNIGGVKSTVATADPAGRWPANVILDETQAEVLDGQSGVMRDGVAVRRNRPAEGVNINPHGIYGAHVQGPKEDLGYGGSGGASRFFKVAEADEHGAISPHFPREFDAPFKYAPKASKRERPTVDGVAHPTVKPLDLMRWLVRLVTPEGGTVLDPFAGSGTTLEAATLEGLRSIGIEREAEYLPLIQARLDRVA